jgi:hypothetical protein
MERKERTSRKAQAIPLRPKAPLTQLYADCSRFCPNFKHTHRLWVPFVVTYKGTDFEIDAASLVQTEYALGQVKGSDNLTGLVQNWDRVWAMTLEETGSVPLSPEG